MIRCLGRGAFPTRPVRRFREVGRFGEPTLPDQVDLGNSAICHFAAVVHRWLP